MIRFASLGSGSQGNCLLVDAGDTKVLIDCGFSSRATVARLARLGVEADHVDALLVTHEHRDHLAGVSTFARRHQLPVFLTHGTYAEAVRSGATFPEVRLIETDQAFALGKLEVQAFPVPHDAREPIQYVLGDGQHRLGVLTDCGSLTAHVVDVLRHCDALLLECNHDRALLAASRYPAQLKQRIGGRFGHLANDDAALLLQQIETSSLQHVVAAHLSDENNRPHLAAGALAASLGCHEHWIGIADQQQGFDWREIR